MALNLDILNKNKPSTQAPTNGASTDGPTYLDLSKIQGLDLSKPFIIFNLNAKNEQEFTALQTALATIMQNATPEDLFALQKLFQNPALKAAALQYLKSQNL